MRILGIDYGDSRVGLAVSDALGITANGLLAVSIKNNFNNAISEIVNVCNEYEVETLVIGYPKNMDGTLGFRVQATEKFITALLERLKDCGREINVVRWDERLTTVQAQRTMRETGVSARKKGKGIVDKIAAEIILQGYLDSL